MGFDMDKGYIHVEYSSQLTSDSKQPCLVIDTTVYPKYTGWEVKNENRKCSIT